MRARSATSLSSFFAYVYAIKFAHEVSDFADPVAGSFPRLIISGAKKELRKLLKPKKPVPSAIVKKICSLFGGDAASLRQNRFAAMAVLAYAGFL